jgi:radical SAM superfamily enzyme YgiQ (UPF0313 family)
MKVLLISPAKLTGLKESKGTIPVPLIHLAAALRAHDHIPSILDFSIYGLTTDSLKSHQVLEETINEFQPDMVGINCFTTLHFPVAQTISRLVKSLKSDSFVALGGTHPSLFPKEILKHVSSIDSIIMGEGEIQIVMLADVLQSQNMNEISSIPSIAYRNGSGDVVITERDGFIDDLDSLPQPAWDLIDLSAYYTDLSTWYNPKKLDFHLSVPILTSRACPFSCNFCACYATMGRKFRKRSPINVVDEIQMLHEKEGQNYFGFIDDNINLDKRHIIEICAEIQKRNLNIQYETTCGTHIASLDEEVIDALADSGCVFVRLPIEHGNDYIRNHVIGKKLEREKIYNAAFYLKKKKIFTSSMYIMGFPEETNESLEDTYQMICELKLDLNYVFNIIPFPGTKIFQQAMEDGLFVDDFNPSELWKGLINLDPVQDDCRFFIKPYHMELEELMHYRELFDNVQFFSSLAKTLNSEP